MQVGWALSCLSSANQMAPEDVPEPLLELLQQYSTGAEGMPQRLTQALYDCHATKDVLTAVWLKLRLHQLEYVLLPGLSESDCGSSSSSTSSIDSGSVSSNNVRLVSSSRTSSDVPAAISTKQPCVMTARVLVTPTRCALASLHDGECLCEACGGQYP